MVRKIDWKSWIVLGLVVAFFVTSGGLIMASNMGFKINKQLFAAFSAGAAPKRDNWISLPYNNPYPTAEHICNAFGFTGLQRIIKENPITGRNDNNCGCLGGTNAGTECGVPPGTPASCLGGGVCTCGETGFNYLCSGAAGPAAASGAGYLVRGTAASPVTVSGILVGSSNETQALPTMYGSFKAAGAPKLEGWISVPYHTTWVRSSDVCVSLGLTAALSGSVTRINADPLVSPNTISHNCPSIGTNEFNLVIGEALLIRKNTAGNIVGSLPPHF
jgi:hypothetical protein